MAGAVNSFDFLATREGAGPCPKCRTRLPLLVDCAATYFANGFLLCNHCGERVDLWGASVDQAIRLRDVSDSALISLGAKQSWFPLAMETGKHYVVDLTQYKIPADAKILSRRYTPQGGEQGAVSAVEWYPNDSTHRFRGTPLSLVAVPVMEGPLPRTGQVLVILTWVDADDADAWPYLARAFDSAAAREYEPALVFAQSAVEISMMPLIEQRFRRHASAEHVENFMRDSLTYSYALNVVLPYLSAELGSPKMPDAVRGALNKLRKKRNEIIHRGTKAAAITPQDAMEGLCAAAFGFEYMRYVGPTLLEAK